MELKVLMEHLYVYLGEIYIQILMMFGTGVWTGDFVCMRYTFHHLSHTFKCLYLYFCGARDRTQGPTCQESALLWSYASIPRNIGAQVRSDLTIFQS
jgi:hypothetical protein